MKRASKSHSRTNHPRRPRLYRLTLEQLEERLPLGEALFGVVVGVSWLGATLSARGAEPLAPESKVLAPERGSPTAEAVGPVRPEADQRPFVADNAVLTVVVQAAGPSTARLEVWLRPPLGAEEFSASAWTGDPLAEVDPFQKTAQAKRSVHVPETAHAGEGSFEGMGGATTVPGPVAEAGLTPALAGVAGVNQAASEVEAALLTEAVLRSGVAPLPRDGTAAPKASLPPLPEPPDGGTPPGTQTVVRLQITPGDSVVRLDGTVFFTAIGYNAAGVPVGVRPTWRAYDTDGNRAVRIAPEGKFLARLPGTFRVTAEAEGQQDEVYVHVPQGGRRDPNERPRIVSQVSARLPHGDPPTLPPMPNDGPTWNDQDFPAAFDPENQRGRSPDALATKRQGLGDGEDAPGGGGTDLPTENPGSSNFTITAPVLHLPGRGLDLNLNLVYNSRLWSKAVREITYDKDADWPAPGWSLGFGRLVRIGSYGATLFDGDGTRHPFQGETKCYGAQQTGCARGEYVGKTTDGSLVDMSAWAADAVFTGAWARYPNGTVVEFTAPGPGAIYPTRITDANGNFLTITYRNNSGPALESITDTLGRVVFFHYDTTDRLTAITGPGLNGGARQLIRLHYTTRTLGYAFAQPLTPKVRGCDAQPCDVTLIDALYYPATRTGYWFGDTAASSPSYSSYGMLAKVSEQRAMTFVASSLNEQGTVTPGAMTRERVYNYPLTSNPALTDAPAYSTRTESWAAMTTPPAVTRYNVDRNVQPPQSRRVEVAHPDGTSVVQFFRNAREFDNGLVTDTYTMRPGWSVLTHLKWQRGNYEAPQLERVTVTDERNRQTKTEYVYGPVYNQVTEVREYDYDLQTVLRRVKTEYVNAAPYTTDRHIFNLPQTVEVYEGNAARPAARTEYRYDAQQGQALPNTPGVVAHVWASNPYEPPLQEPPDVELECDYEQPRRKPPCRKVVIPGRTIPVYRPVTDYRGNVSAVTRYADAANLAGAVTETRRYDRTGNLITASTSCCEQMSFQYTVATQYAYPTEHTRGAANPSSPARVTTRAVFDFQTGLPLSATDANGLTTQTDYDPASLRPLLVTWNTGATSSYQYDDAALTVTTTTRLANATLAGKSTQLVNGLGLVVRQETLAENNQSSVVVAQYDQMGRLQRQSRPFFCTNQPPCTSQPQYWSERFYDALGRVTRQREPDGSEETRLYNEATRPTGASAAPGQTVEVVDAWGRRRWSRTNALGQLVEMVMPNPEGDGSFTMPGHEATLYAYNAFDQVTRVTQQPGPQERLFRYDSLGRLTHQYLPEKRATLNDEGRYAAGGTWSDVFTYDARSNLTAHTDARGLATLYVYRDDPLNRLREVRYRMDGFGDDTPVTPSGNVFLDYMTTGDVTRPLRVTTDGVGSEVYGYDAQGRLNAKTLTLLSRPAYPLAVDYVFDTVNRLTDLRYPAEYGAAGTPRRLVHQDYDVASRPQRLQVESADYASQIVYNEASQITSLRVGASGPQQVTELYAYDAVTGLLTGQQVRRAGSSLLDLSYDYVRPGLPGHSGQLVHLTDNNSLSKSRAYTYDAWGRLVQAKGGNPYSPLGPLWQQDYFYDRHGNRIGTAANGMAADGSPIPVDGLPGVPYDVRTNRITLPGFQYDAAGNLTRGRGPDGSWQQYRYDVASRLTQVLTDAGRTLEAYTYNGASRQRLVTQHGVPAANERTYYVWNGNTVLAEYRETPASPTAPRWSRSYVQLGSRLLATLTPSAVQYHHPDRLGTRLVTSATAPAVREQVTLPFGTALDAESRDPTDRRFTSYDRSAATGLDYAVNRTYHAQQGRFTQPDPLGMGAASLGDPQSLNLYAYVGHDPVNATDPLGLRWVLIPGTPGKFYFDGDAYVIEAGQADRWVWVDDPDENAREDRRGGREGGERSNRGGGNAKEPQTQVCSQTNTPAVNQLPGGPLLPLSALLRVPPLAERGPTLSSISAEEMIQGEKRMQEELDLMREYPGAPIELARIARSAKGVNAGWKQFNALFGGIAASRGRDLEAQRFTEALLFDQSQSSANPPPGDCH